MATNQKDRLSEERLSSKNPKQGKQGLSERKSSEDMRKESSNKGRL